MAKHDTKRKTRSDKFPLTLHPTGQYCKKIRGKLYYFGTNKKEALQRYLERAVYLHAGQEPKVGDEVNKITLKMLCNLYLEHQYSRVAVGEIKPRQLYDQTSLLRSFVKYVGSNQSIIDIHTIDLQNYRAKLIKSGKLPNTINNRISAFKAMFHWALENEIITTVPNLKAIKKITEHKRARATFKPDHIKVLLEHANAQMKVMIWLGLNCGFGCTDCAELLWKHLHFEEARVHFPRGKTGIDRNIPLWPETIVALKNLRKKGDHVFYTAKGNIWVRTIKKVGENGITKYTKDNAIGKEFSKLIKKAGIKTEKGVGFYTLRRTAATLAARSGDPFAVQRLLGHADLKMATTYVQDVSEQTDRVINNSRKLICQDDF